MRVFCGQPIEGLPTENPHCPLCGLEDDISTTWVYMRVFYVQPIEGLLTENPHRALKGEKLLLAK